MGTFKPVEERAFHGEDGHHGKKGHITFIHEESQGKQIYRLGMVLTSRDLCNLPSSTGLPLSLG